jgi:hypothetical protein
VLLQFVDSSDGRTDRNAFPRVRVVSVSCLLSGLEGPSHRYGDCGRGSSRARAVVSGIRLRRRLQHAVAVARTRWLGDFRGRCAHLVLLRVTTRDAQHLRTTTAKPATVG